MQSLGLISLLWYKKYVTENDTIKHYTQNILTPLPYPARILRNYHVIIR